MIQPNRRAGQILAENLRRLMGDGPNRLRQTFLVSKGVPQSRIGAVLKGSRSVRIDVLDAIAEHFNMHPWQLLVMDLDPKQRPLLRAPRGAEAEFYRRMQAAARELGIDAE